jgi:hypothetical protein
MMKTAHQSLALQQFAVVRFSCSSLVPVRRTASRTTECLWHFVVLQRALVVLLFVVVVLSFATTPAVLPQVLGRIFSMVLLCLRVILVALGFRYCVFGFLPFPRFSAL